GMLMALATVPAQTEQLVGLRRTQRQNDREIEGVDLALAQEHSVLVAMVTDDIELALHMPALIEQVQPGTPVHRQRLRFCDHVRDRLVRVLYGHTTFLLVTI